MMASSWFFDENFNGISDEFLDAVKFLDFPLEEDMDGNEEDWDAQFQCLGPPPSDILDGFSTASQSKVCSDASEHQKNNSILFGEPSVLKPLPSTVPGRFHTCSPVSVLEGSNSCPVEANKPLDTKTVFPLKRARSKRRRPLFFNPWLAISIAPSAEKCHQLCVSGRISESDDISETQFPVKRKHQRNDLSSSDTWEMKKRSPQQPILTRKCTHCETTKTPQWREGPLGPKTLCNACGVRYRTGRLFPEYRPAASPTFVESLHSNSHKKVVEMRKARNRIT